MTPAVLLVLAVTLTAGAIYVAMGPAMRATANRRALHQDEEPSSKAAQGAANEAIAESPSAAAPEASALDSGEIYRQLHCLALGVTELRPSNMRAHAQMSAHVAALVDRVAGDTRYAPRRPLLLPQLLRAVNDGETSRNQLADIVAQDPALVGSLLKLANSAFYRVNPHPVESIDRALALLGTEGLRALVATALMQPVFRLAGGKAATFSAFPEIAWEHTVRSATAAQAHAAFVENKDRFAGQLLGLLMGLGGIVVFRIVVDAYLKHPRLAPDAAFIAAALDAHSARASTRIAESWEVSDRIRGALAYETTGSALDPPGPLVRSLRFGQLMGALSVLHAHEKIDDETARASMLANGASTAHVDRIWARLGTAA